MYYEKTERRTEMPQKSGLKKNLFLSTFYQVLKMVLPLITAPYAARVLGVDGTGIYSYTHAYVTYFMLFGALGMVSYGGREIARHRNNKDERSQIFWEIAILTFVTTMISILAWGIWILFNREYRIYYIILTFYLVGTMFDISWLYGGMEEFKYTVTQNSLFKILGTISIFVFVKKAEDLWIYILIMSLTTCLANISMWILHPKLNTLYERKPFDVKDFRMDISEPYDLTFAQVCHGGIDLSEVDENLMIKRYPNLFAMGEILDMDGICGGYNLFFAFATAIMVAERL